MRKLRCWIVRLGGMFGRRRREAELAAEIESHLQLHIADNLRAGMTAEEARRMAMIKLGGVEQTKEAYRERMGAAWILGFAHDARFGLRMLRKNPGFAAVAILTLALGIGTNTAMFSVVYGALLAPLPYPNPDELVMVWSSVNGHGNTVSTGDYLDWKRESTAFQDMAAWSGGDFNLSSGGRPEVVGARITTPDFLSMQGIPVAMGRNFVPEDGEVGRDHVAIMTHRFWEDRFGSDPNIIGQDVRLNGESYTVVGVLAAGMADRFESPLFLPLAFTPEQMTHDYRWLDVMGRLKPGVTLQQANANMDAVTRNIAEVYPASNKGWSARVESLKNDFTSTDTIKDLWLLLGAVGFVLLIACVNVANLLLARATVRQKEVAVRSALGATRGQLFAQFLAESLTLATIGGAFGVALAWMLLKGILALLPPFSIPTEADVRLNVPVLVFSVAATFVAGVLCGCAPAWQSAQGKPNEALKEGGRTGASAGRHGLRKALVVAEFALALLAGAALVIHSFWKMTRADLGFRQDHVLTFSLPIRAGRFANADEITSFYRGLLDRIEALPGVSSAAISTGLPATADFGSKSFSIAGQAAGDPAARPNAGFTMVTPGYFRTFGIPIEQGRGFTEQDLAGGVLVAIVNQSFVEKYLAGVDPLSQRVVMAQSIPGDRKLGPQIEWQIVGVFRDVRRSGIHEQGEPEIYVPFSQSPWPSAIVELRTAGNPASMSSNVAAVVQSVDADLGLDRVRTMDQIVDESFDGYRFATVLFAGFAGVALMLAAIGIYGVMSFAVAQRTNEIGLRMALGASPGGVLRLVLREGMMLALAGLAIGLAGAYVVGRVMQSTLYEVTAMDPAAIGVVAGVLFLAAVAASCVPARRAMRVDPMVALRHE